MIFLESPCYSPDWSQAHEPPDLVFQALSDYSPDEIESLAQSMRPCVSKKEKKTVLFNRRSIIILFQLSQLFNFKDSDTFLFCTVFD